MTIGRARAILSYLWVVMSIPLIAIVFLQTVNKKFEEWETGFGWLIPLVFPVLSFIIATWTVAESRKDQLVLKNRYVFVASMLLSVFYLLSLYTIVVLMPREFDEFRNYVKEVLRPSSWYLGTIQAIVVVVVGKFFLEEIAIEAHTEGGREASHTARRRKATAKT